MILSVEFGVLDDPFVQLTMISLEEFHLQTTLGTLFLSSLGLCSVTCKSFQFHGGSQVREAAKVDSNSLG